MNALQIQQARLNQLAQNNGKRIAVILEGRDSAGKSGTIRELTQYLSPNWYSVSTTTKPTKNTMKNWLRFWKKRLQKTGKITFFDRSHYSRALCQKVNGWCSARQYGNFMRDVNAWENSQDVIFVKFWLSITEKTQIENLTNRELSPLQYWKLSPNDKLAVAQYNDYTIAKETMLAQTGEWHSINYDNKAEGRLKLITTLCDILEAKIMPGSK